MKSVVIITFIFIVISLATALFYMVRHKTNAESEKTMLALSVRSGLSIVLFILLFIAVANKILTPHRFGKPIATPTSSPTP